MSILKKSPFAIMCIVGLIFMAVYLIIDQSETSSAAGNEITAVEQAGYSIEVSLGRAPAQILKNNELQVHISDVQGNPVSHATIHFLLKMPHMFCGTFEGTASQTEPGAYQGNAVPLMEGDWEALVDIELNGQTLHVTHPFKAAR
ncbi:FixH family protein [Paenibacillus hexagrammi]|uniref:FixH family protein n=1 Tax=Paenibacillus hexagrammi TaxID=2908839 RepID=A0ABY3SMI6_9BACL|nr:FixH family protein [Paenibacillus sp. YPD9-1]UJF34939.1 FixH family protein [Paenibacillus sp. YPD9-1]